MSHSDPPRHRRARLVVMVRRWIGSLTGLLLLALSVVTLNGCDNGTTGHASSSNPSTARGRGVVSACQPITNLLPGMPPVLDPCDIYSADRSGDLSAPAAAARPLIYVPNALSDTVDEIDPTTNQVVREFGVGALPQHVVPSWDLKTLWVTNDQGNSLTPIDPVTGEPGRPVPVEDPYNLYFTPDGRFAIVVA
jgi:YVTN family beta-propeller protein